MWWKFLSKTETANDYKEGLEFCARYYDIKGMVCDGILGVKKLCLERKIPFQSCLAHIQRKVFTKLTRKPKSEAGKVLLKMNKRLFKWSKKCLKGVLEMFYARFENYLKERTYSPNGKWHYTHGSVRSAYFTLWHNLDHIYTYLEVSNMPCTNNEIESFFSDIKHYMNTHKALQKQGKMRFISWYIYFKNSQSFRKM